MGPATSKGKKLTKEHIEKLKNAKIGHVPHNKNKTRFDLRLIEELLNKGESQIKVAKIFNTDQGYHQIESGLYLMKIETQPMEPKITGARSLVSRSQLRKLL